MLTVDHVVQPSPIHGLGVFTREPVCKGQIIWLFDDRIDREIAMADLDGLPGHMVNYLFQHAEFFETRQIFVLGSDGDCYMNHADTPTLVDGGAVLIAARDLKAGAELTCDYRVVRVLGFDPDRVSAQPLPILLAHGRYSVAFAGAPLRLGQALRSRTVTGGLKSVLRDTLP